MNSTPTSSPDGDQDSTRLPPLHSAVLDLDQVQRLLADIEACTSRLEVLPKYAPQAHVPDRSGVTLQTAREMLAGRTVRGLQLRYHYDGADWWDTLMLTGDRFRIVRIRHDFDAPATV